MKIYFIRHGETKEGAAGIILGSTGGNLSPNGVKYSEDVAEFLITNKIPVARLLCSDLNRAVRTAEIISKKMNISPTKSTLIRERAAGVAEGKKDQDIDWVKYESEPFSVRKHLGGESFQDVKRRAEQFLDVLIRGEQEDVLVVSHAVFILMFLSLVKGTAMETELKTKIGNKMFVVDLARKTVDTIEITHSQ